MKYHTHALFISLALACFATTARAAKTIGFKEAAVMATNTKGCAKKMIDKIAKVNVLVDSAPDMRGVYIDVCDETCERSRLFGPLDARPTAAQLASLSGRPMCVPAD